MNLRAARFVTGNYICETGSTNGTLEQLKWESLKTGGEIVESYTFTEIIKNVQPATQYAYHFDHLGNLPNITKNVNRTAGLAKSYTDT